MHSTIWNEASMREETLHVRGNWLARQCQVHLGAGGPVLASVSRDIWTAKQFFAQASKYAIHVAPGGVPLPLHLQHVLVADIAGVIVDASLIVALCICLDEIHEQKSAAAATAAC
jgi:uncharacterized protein YxjI